MLVRLGTLSKVLKWWCRDLLVSWSVGGSGEVPECLKVKESTEGAGAVVGGTHDALPAPQTLSGQVVHTLLPPNAWPAAQHGKGVQN